MTAFIIVFFTIKGMVKEPALYQSKQECVKAAVELDKKANKARSCFEVVDGHFTGN